MLEFILQLRARYVATWSRICSRFYPMVIYTVD